MGITSLSARTERTSKEGIGIAYNAPNLDVGPRNWVTVTSARGVDAMALVSASFVSVMSPIKTRQKGFLNDIEVG